MAEYTIDKIEYGSDIYKLQDNISGYITAADIPTRGTATSGGTTLSLVNTGDMYTWDNKTQVQIIRW